MRESVVSSMLDEARPIATRTLDGPDNELLALYAPERDERGEDWICRCSIGAHRFEAFGADSMQALLLALAMLSHELSLRQKGAATWLDLARGGFPVIDFSSL